MVVSATPSVISLSKKIKKYATIILSDKLRLRVYSDPNELKKKVDAFLLAYDRQEADMRMRSKEKIVDDDGFELVQAKVTGAPAPVSPETSSKKRKSDGVDDFYKFQLKERKLAEWGEVKRQELADKQTLEDMKRDRKFQL